MFQRQLNAPRERYEKVLALNSGRQIVLSARVRILCHMESSCHSPHSVHMLSSCLARKHHPSGYMSLSDCKCLIKRARIQSYETREERSKERKENWRITKVRVVKEPAESEVQKICGDKSYVQ